MQVVVVLGSSISEKKREYINYPRWRMMTRVQNTKKQQQKQNYCKRAKELRIKKKRYRQT